MKAPFITKVQTVPIVNARLRPISGRRAPEPTAPIERMNRGSRTPMPPARRPVTTTTLRMSLRGCRAWGANRTSPASSPRTAKAAPNVERDANEPATPTASVGKR